MVFTIFA
ncbi:255b414c-4d0f-40b4-959a-dd9935b3e77f [Thermothielavioides terrestris]|nr:255b414c-4d0f-40b4-959a-dd9935b3e77f [Thermothielavioides terrestris]